MTDQTACRPGTIATIGLPADMAVVSAIVAGIVRTRPGVRAVQHQDHLDVCAPAPEAHDPQNTLCVPPGRPVSVSGDSGACGGSCGGATGTRGTE